MADAEPAAEPAPRSLRLHALLFVLTCITTFVAGGLQAREFSITVGLEFGGTLMFILTCHEMGHYLVARHHGIDTSLPYFIPLPPGISLGTMGAVIRMRDPISDRNRLIDVGAAGPLAGLAVALPLLALGLWLSPLGPPASGEVMEGNSILYLLLKLAIKGQILPSASGTDVQLHPVAFAAWVGLLITFINLIPIGQLDGGHIACSYLGPRHERFSAWLHRGLLAVGAAVLAVLSLAAHRHGRDLWASLGYGLQSALPWLVWAGLLVLMRRMSGGIYHPPTDGGELSPGRRRLVLFMAIVFLLIFTPVPMRGVLAP